MRVCPSFENISVLVIGDVMLDRFWSGATHRVSPEAPVPVVKVAVCHNRAGGAGNVAVNIASLGAHAKLAGLCGEDEAAQSLRASVEASGVQWAVTPCAAETIVKLRVLSRNQQLLRMDFEGNLSEYADDLFLSWLKTLLVDIDVVVLSDYGKGTLNRVAELITACRELGKPVLVDPKGIDLNRYRGASLLTPNLSEFEAVVGKCHSDEELLLRGVQLREDLDLNALLITRSERGMTLFERGQAPLHLPARAREVYDVTGAGDTVISVMASAIGAGETLASATALANAAAGVVVAKVGTASVTRDELSAALAQDVAQNIPHIAGVLTLPQLMEHIGQARASGERIVMTNGCFDILHAGHVSYLDGARRLGDRLIVAVNSDDSVARLKGPSRPINSLAARMAVLAGLRSVDWVVSFNSDTPAELIAQVLPDVLAKGGDYMAETVVGYDAVVGNGGKVVILDFLAGYSTSRTIESVRGEHTG